MNLYSKPRIYRERDYWRVDFKNDSGLFEQTYFSKWSDAIRFALGVHRIKSSSRAWV